MLGFYTPVLLLQGFCIYHSYRNNSIEKWLWLIIFLPFLGSVIYLYDHFFNRQTINNISNEIKTTLNPNFELNQVEKQAIFSDTVSNKLDLAEVYIKKSRFSDAAEIYDSCLEGIYTDDIEIISSSIKANFLSKNYNRVIQLGKKATVNQSFNNSEEKIALAWSFHYQKDNVTARRLFEEMNILHDNYKNRLEYAKFLNLTDQKSYAKGLLETLQEEFSSMNRLTMKTQKPVINGVKTLYKEI